MKKNKCDSRHVKAFCMVEDNIYSQCIFYHPNFIGDCYYYQPSGYCINKEAIKKVEK
jgi:hypothetical protein